MHRFSHARMIGMAIVATLGITAACSDGGTSTSESSSELGDTTATSAGTKATGEPIRIGFVNSEGGAFSVPELRVGNEVAETYINDQLGGVKGRPLQVTRCTTDGSP
ncbi:MAG: ABC transporter substrate-binding protein, partial [Acidimicrobiales bacterium]